MKDPVIFSIFSAGGFGVLISYYFLYIIGALSKLSSYYTKLEWRTWTFSMLVTIVSILALIIWFSFYQKLEGWQRTTFISSLSVFLAFAMLWSASIAYIYLKNKDILNQRPFLFIVALATIGLLVATCYSTDNWPLIAAAAIVVFHHLFFDAFYWVHIHSRSKIEKKRKNKSKK